MEQATEPKGKNIELYSIFAIGRGILLTNDWSDCQKPISQGDESESDIPQPPETMVVPRVTALIAVLLTFIAVSTLWNVFGAVAVCGLGGGEGK